MFVDASALCAIIGKESDAALYMTALERSKRSIISPTAVWETVVAASRLLDRSPDDAETVVDAILRSFKIDIVPIPPEAAALAVDAFARFGRGRHRAALNFGDCFAYACARHYRMPLLYKGDDFAATDIEAA